jgi:hypothetical protein
MNDFTIIAGAILLGVLFCLAAPKNKLYGDWSAAERLFGASLGTLFFAGAVLVIGTRFAFSLPHGQRNDLFLVGLALVFSPIVIGYLAAKLRHR